MAILPSSTNVCAGSTIPALQSQTKRATINARDPTTNRLIAALPAAEFQRWLPMLEFVEMKQGDLLYVAGQKLNYVFFPTTAMISLQYGLADGHSSEIAVIGKEGVVGASVFMVDGPSYSNAEVQIAGQGFRLKAGVIKQFFNDGGPAVDLVLRYTQALMTQMALTAVCNRHHNLEQQFCRWLLLSLDRIPTNEMCITHELLGHMLGVRREGITSCASRLQKKGFIRYARGRITVLNRPALEEQACECYEVGKQAYERLLPENLRPSDRTWPPFMLSNAA